MSDEYEPTGDSDEGFLARALEHDGEVYRYVVWRPPGFAARSAWPGVLFLHGVGECGTDGTQHVLVGLPPVLRTMPQEWPFVVILPQKPRRELEWEDMGVVLDLMLDHAVSLDRLDVTELHLSGLSQGGHGALVIGSRHPEGWRTISAVCPYLNSPSGGWSENAQRSWDADDMQMRAIELSARLHSTPVWLFHGDADEAVSVQHSLAFHERVRARDNEQARLTLYPGVGHAAWDAAYAREGLARWMQRGGLGEER